jgi:ribosomal protein S18 acetylase RimI-like enzyme
LEEVAAKELGFPAGAVSHYRKILSDEEIGRRLRMEQHMLLEAVDTGRLMGVLIGLPPEGGVGTLWWVIVAAKYRRRGIARALVDAACARYRAAGCHKVKLTVPNVAAKRFYEALGMRVEGTHRDHWWHMDFWSMGKLI